MLDFGWLELFLILAVMVIVIGPDDIPAVMVTIGRIVRRLQYMRYAISQQFDDVMRDADIDDIRKSVNFEAPDDTDEAAADAEYAVLPDTAERAEPEEADDERA